jgi:squalene-associated FAD-dependent desaturase
MTPRVAVIGGGWSGCAAALTLAEAGVVVSVYEAGAVLGGRARSLDLNGMRLDNGQHVLLGAYRQTLDLIDAVSSPVKRHASLLRSRLILDHPPTFKLDCPALPAPWHLLVGLFRARGLSWRDKLAAARWAHDAIHRIDQADQSVAHAIAAQPAAVRRALWEPLCVAALNTPPADASANVFMHILRTTFGNTRAHSDLLFPCVDLGALFPVPAASRIRQLGGEIRLHTRVRNLTSGEGDLTVNTQHETTNYDFVILAVAPQHLASLCEFLPGLLALADTVRGYRYLPIATVYLQYPATVRLPRPMMALAGEPAQFAFDRGQTHGQPGLIALVASAAANLLGRAQVDWTAQAERQLERIQQLPAPLWRKCLIEKQATYACTPAMKRPGTTTRHPRIFLAGDYVEGPYPATLESATRSGVKSAQVLLEQI